MILDLIWNKCYSEAALLLLRDYTLLLDMVGVCTDEQLKSVFAELTTLCGNAAVRLLTYRQLADYPDAWVNVKTILEELVI